ncbi:MipA/OmpV family protein [Sphingomonas hankyongi]|uniref:MipA/OmpV family protein n=1 Tax=Sphingomonas hankyongi TaxID=2908209 RepID=A0ABT0S199_9SPHN|nr:MipA/OmpV family protein [Sphingomonas hankyongi]MCL6729335.1 MipA/OmpV family protein [Sphingomonas hankyongi]
MKPAPFAILLAFASSAAIAQDSNDLRVRVGLGAQLRPEYLGSDNTQIAPLWDIDIARGTKPFHFEAPDDKFGIALISSDTFSAGPTAHVEWKRKESDVGAPVGKVPTTFEAGVFAQFLPTQSIRLRGDVRKGIGGHEGVVGGLSIDKIWRDGDKYVFSVGPRISFSDAKYQRAYFGVDTEASTASGLPAYRPGGGLHAAGVASGLSYQFSDRFGMFGFARYERLIGDAAKSPIVRELGSRDQLSGGLGLSYTFTIQR